MGPDRNLQLQGSGSSAARLPRAGALLVAISPQAADHSLSLTEKHGLAFPVLSDLGQEVILAYRVQFTLAGDLEIFR